MHYRGRHRQVAQGPKRLRRAFLTVGMASALTGTFAVTTVSPASAVLCDPEVSTEIQMNTSNVSSCGGGGGGGGGSIEPSPIVQVLVEWVVTTPDGLILSGSSSEDVSGGSGSDVPVPMDLIDLSSLGDAAGAKKCRAGDGWSVKSHIEARTRFYTAFKYHTDFMYTYNCTNVTNVYNFKVYPSDLNWQGWEFQGHQTPPTGVSTYPKPTVSIIGQGNFAQCLPSPIGQYCSNKTTATITWNAFGSGARPKGEGQLS